MKLLVLADTHLTSLRHKSFDPLNQSRIGLLQVANYVKSHHVDAVVIAGDVFHDKTFVYKNAMDVLYEFIEMLGDVPLYLIQGNHDVSRHGSLLDLIHGPNVTTVTDEPIVIENVLLVPWHRGNILQTIYENKRDYTNVLISHFGVNEAQLQSGISFIDPIKCKDLKIFDLVILGHYHLPQHLEHIVYCGNLVPIDWNDKNQKKRFIEVDTETLDWKSVEIQGVVEFFEFVDPDEEELEYIKHLTQSGHQVRVITPKKISIEGAAVIYNVPKTELKEISSVYDAALKHIEQHPEREELKEILDEIDSRVRGGDQWEQN